MSKLPSIELGTFGPGPREGKPFKIDLDLLMEQNLLLQANSGGGKSWALRRLVEQAFGKLPIIVIDPEGEFSTLRQKFDLVVVGKGGETPADVRSAKLLAHRLLELRASAVCDLFELQPVERARWFAAFIEALVEAPKNLWGDVLVAVDEAHDFAPEGGHGRVRGDSSGALAAATRAFAALASKGRKRGQLTVAATQRLGKFSKDVAAELKNVLVGLTWIDIDRERAAESLGIARANKPEFFDRIKQMEPGSFFGLGRALGLLDPTPVRSGPIETEHPKRGRRQSAPPPPTAKIKHLLPQLSDLPKEAEENLKTEAGLRAEVAKLRAELARAGKAAPASNPERIRVVEVPVSLRRSLADLGRKATRLAADAGEVTKRAHDLGAAIETASKEAAMAAQVPAPATSGTSTSAPAKAFVARRIVVAPAVEGPDGEWRPGGGPLRMLQALATSHADGLTWKQIGTLSKLRQTGSFRNYKSALRQHGCVEERGERVFITEVGRAYAGDVGPAVTGLDLVDYWRPKLPSQAGVMLDLMVKRGQGAVITRQELLDTTGLREQGSFRNYLSRLRTNGLMEQVEGGFTAADVFFR